MREERKEDYKAMVDLTGDIIVTADIDGRWTFVNDAACQFWGKSRRELIGALFTEYLHSDDKDNTFSVIEKVRGGAVVKGFVNRQKTPEGWRDVEWNRAPIFGAGNSYAGFQATGRDITERKRAQEELEDLYRRLKNAQLQLVHSEKMAAVGQLAAGVAHEINNPLAFVLMNFDFLKQYISDFIEADKRLSGLADKISVLDDEKGTDLKKEIQDIHDKLRLDSVVNEMPEVLDESLEGIKRIREIVRNLLSFSRQRKVGFASIDIREVIEQAVTLVWHEIKLKCRVVKELGDVPKIMADAGQLGQVFINLLMNAYNAIEKEGVITVKAGFRNGSVVVEISDNGRGIPEENIGKIFEPFFTSQESGKGTGLGLSLTHNIIANHKGTIEVKSKIGAGTTFVITLPAK